MDKYKHILPVGKEPLPQTVENLQRIMAKDCELMLEMRGEIAALKAKVNQQRQSIIKLRGKQL